MCHGRLCSSHMVSYENFDEKNYTVGRDRYPTFSLLFFANLFTLLQFAQNINPPRTPRPEKKGGEKRKKEGRLFIGITSAEALLFLGAGRVSRRWVFVSVSACGQLRLLHCSLARER